MRDKLDNWRMLAGKSSKTVTDFFFHVVDVCKEISRDAICYDLTDGLQKFFEKGVVVSGIASAKKIAQEGDFLISRLRSYLQEMGIVEKRQKDQIFSTEFLVFRQKTNQISSFTLFALCMTDTVQTILKRGQYGTEHPRFYDFLLTKLPVPDCLSAIDPSIQKAMQQALRVRALSRDIYHQTQSILLSELGLTNWRPNHQSWFVKHYTDLQKAERIDADYFQPKYDEIVNAIQNYSGGYGVVGDLLNLKAKNHNPDGAREYKYIELANITENGEVAGCTTAQGRDLPDRARCKVAENDVIVSSVEGSLEKIAMIREEYSRDSLCSTGFHVVNSEIINPETLLVFLKSVAGRMQLKKGCSGTILTAISEDEFRKIVLPTISKEKQAQIKEKVAESFALSKQSKHLLESAKRAVEIAIEENERAAVKWLEKQTENANRAIR
ncbi:MAG: hypothetical protein OXU71_05615 [Gammaproteobacteria bacterium]|nr:hypothetical protein [Gammaproteobacteria bacterium]